MKTKHLSRIIYTYSITTSIKI